MIYSQHRYASEALENLGKRVSGLARRLTMNKHSHIGWRKEREDVGQVILGGTA